MKMARWVGLMLVVVGLIGVGLPESATAQSPQIIKIAWSPDGQEIGVGYYNGDLEIWNVSGQMQRSFVGHTHGVGVIAWSPSGTQIASGSRDELFIWNTGNGQIIADLNARYGYPSSITEISWNRDGSQIIVYVFDEPNRARKIWDANTFELIGEGSLNSITDIQWSIDKNHLAMGTNAGGVMFADPANFNVVSSAVEDGVVSIAISLGGQRIASGNWANTIKIWAIPDGGGQSITYVESTVVQTLRSSSVQPVHRTTYILDVVFSLSGNRVYSVSGSGEFAAWNANASNQPPILTTQLPDAPITAAAFNQLGTKLAYGDVNGELHIVDVATLVPPETYGELPTFFRISDGQAANRLLQ